MDTGPCLFPTEVGDYMSGLLRGNRWNRWHITEVPVMLAHAIPYCHVHRQVCMMFTPVYIINQWRALLGAPGLVSVTQGTLRYKELLTLCRIAYEAGWRQMQRRQPRLLIRGLAAAQGYRKYNRENYFHG